MTAIMSGIVISQFATVKTVIQGPVANSFRVPTAALIRAFAIKACATANQASAGLIARRKLVPITALIMVCAMKTRSAYASRALKE